MEKRVLVVDDDLHIRQYITVNLKARGYRVFQAVDGVEALSVLNDEYIDLVILDVTMPRMDGFEVLRLLRKWSSVPVIMLSAVQDVGCKARCFELGADDYMTKPFSLREFLARVETEFRKRGQKQAPKE